MKSKHIRDFTNRKPNRKAWPGDQVKVIYNSKIRRNKKHIDCKPGTIISFGPYSPENSIAIYRRYKTMCGCGEELNLNPQDFEVAK